MTRCGKDLDELDPRVLGVHRCTPSPTHALEDLLQSLLKRLDGLERFDNDAWHGAAVMDKSSIGEWISFDQVKTMIAHWVAEQQKPV